MIPAAIIGCGIQVNKLKIGGSQTISLSKKSLFYNVKTVTFYDVIIF